MLESNRRCVLSFAKKRFLKSSHGEASPGQMEKTSYAVTLADPAKLILSAVAATILAAKVGNELGISRVRSQSLVNWDFKSC